MSKPLRLRLRCAFLPNLPVLDCLCSDSTLHHLFEAVASASGQAQDEIKILSGMSLSLPVEPHN